MILMKKFFDDHIANVDEELTPEALEELSNNKGDED